MLDLKVVGWGTPAKPTRRRTELFADWVETQAFAAGPGEHVNMFDLADRLTDNGLVVDADEAWTLVADVKRSFRLRQRQIGELYPFAIAGDSIEFINPDRIAYLFCLLISLPEQFRDLRKGYDLAFRNLFEAVVVEAVNEGLTEWEVYPTGWAALANEEEEAKKGEIVRRVARWSLARTYDPSVFPNANDAQVDIAATRPFADNRSSFPVILGQCATGVTDWKGKAARPNLDRWEKAVQFSSKPTKLFAIPFALDDDTFWETATESAGIVLDRHRICSILSNPSPALRDEMTAWIDANSHAIPLAA